MNQLSFAAPLALMVASPAAAAAGELGSEAAAGESASAISGSSVAGVGAAEQPASSPAADDREALLKEIEALRSRVTALENVQTRTTPALSKRSDLAKDHNLELYGFVQLDAIQDFKRVNPDWDSTLRPSRIPTSKGEFGSDGQSVFSVRQSRLGVKANGNLAGKPYEAKFEFDLYGTGVDAGQTTIRVRHIYASWGPFLAGQTNTLFMDGDVFPNVIDYWGPAGMVFVRNPQVRFTFLNNSSWTGAVALEHLSDDIDPGGIRLIDPDLATNIRGDEKLPDLTASIRYKGKWGHVQLAGLLRKIGYDTAGTDDNEPKGHKTGWGLNLTSAINVSLATLRLGVVYGRGIASYMNDGGMDLAPSAELVPFVQPPIFPPPPQPITLNQLLSAEAVKLLGVTAYVDLNWSKRWTSSIGYSFTKVDNTNFQEATAFHRGDYASANLLYHPADNVMTGAEFLWGKRTDNDGESGTDARLQASFKWSFSSENIWNWLN
ncbi:MAG: DcaP family trimeric outer membrane transporter [Sphingomicrobium sp.]